MKYQHGSIVKFYIVLLVSGSRSATCPKPHEPPDLRGGPARYSFCKKKKYSYFVIYLYIDYRHHLPYQYNVLTSSHSYLEETTTQYNLPYTQHWVERIVTRIEK